MVPMWTIPIALTMGNCVILKPSEKVPMTMMRMTELFVEAGMPKGVFQIVHGVADIVIAMCDHPDISAVTFVGSSKVAEIVANRCNAVHKRVSTVHVTLERITFRGRIALFYFFRLMSLWFCVCVCDVMRRFSLLVVRKITS